MASEGEISENFFDRLAYFDGRVDALLHFQQLCEQSMETVGPPPTLQDGVMAIGLFQTKLATEFGRVMQALGVEVQKVMAEKEQFLKERAVDHSGRPVH